MNRNISLLTYFSFGTSLVLLCVWGWSITPLSSETLSQSHGRVYTDTYGETLAVSSSSEHVFILPPEDFSRISPFFFQATLALEDDRFFQHSGVDIPAIIRATIDNISAHHILSGASTLTQQVAKSLLQNPHRTLTAKIQESLFALRLESQFEKEEILSMWANRVSFSGNIVGIGAASRVFFGKHPSDLSLAQSAYLAGIPKNPSAFSPIRFPEQTIQRQHDVLRSMYEKGYITEKQQEHALSETLTFPRKKENPIPHLTAFLDSVSLQGSPIRLSIDAGMQEKVLRIIQQYRSLLRKQNADNIAVAVADVHSGAVRVYVGNADFHDTESSGQVDILQSFRQVGSTLKPLLYLLAFQNLEWTPETIVLDEPAGFPSASGNTFAPKNFDLQYRGELSVRNALAESRNIPAVDTLSALGEQEFQEFLESLGAIFLPQSGDVGLSLALGAREMRPIDLIRMYMVLARGGQDGEICFGEPCTVQFGDQLFDRKNGNSITHILRDNVARLASFGENSPLSFPFSVAVKTGTSRNFRDSYAVGFTQEYVVLVWVGNADASPMREVSGASGAGNIFHDIVMAISSPEVQNTAIDPTTRKPSPLPSDNTLYSPLRILSPLPSSSFLLSHERNSDAQKIRLATNTEADFFLDDEWIFRGQETLVSIPTGEHVFRAVEKENDIEVVFFVGE